MNGTTDPHLQAELRDLVDRYSPATPDVETQPSGYDRYTWHGAEVCVARAFYYQLFDRTVVEIITRQTPSAQPQFDRHETAGRHLPTVAAVAIAHLYDKATAP